MTLTNFLSCLHYDILYIKSLQFIWIWQQNSHVNAGYIVWTHASWQAVASYTRVN